MEAIEDNEFIIFKCPHEECQQYIMVAKKELNCKIFRHGVRKQNFEQMNPHAPKNECDTLVRSNSVYGCTEHTASVIDRYIELLDPIFGVIKECEEGRVVEELLEGPISNSGFTRLN